MTANLAAIQDRLWQSADQLRANSGLSSHEYSTPVLGLIFLRFADQRFAVVHDDLTSRESSRRTITADDYHARGVVYLPEQARFDTLLHLPEGTNIGAHVDDAMRAFEAENPDLRDVLPKTYARIPNTTLATLLRAFATIPTNLDGDAFGRIYEYFLGKFAMSEGQKGGEFFTPTSLVRLIVEIIEPFHGRILDPACGSGGMFVQSAEFVARHKRNPGSELSIYGQEKTGATVRLCRMNLAVHGLSGDVFEANTFYEDAHASVGRFDFVMANPPFNVNGVDKEVVRDDPRFPLGIPRTDNANYLWIQLFASALNNQGRAGFVMANSASDARSSEQEIRRQLLEERVVDVMVSIGPNFFFTVTLPCTLWFFDRGKRGTLREDQVLFIDARQIFRQIDRAHREFTPEQVEFIANLVRLYRGEQSEGSVSLDHAHGTYDFTAGYEDVPGLCKVATLAEIEEQGWSLNPGRYVGVGDNGVQMYPLAERLRELHDELDALNEEAHRIEKAISVNVVMLLEQPTPEDLA